MEMAGVEPASERIDPRIYYERSSFIYFVSIGKMNKTDQDYLLGPESPLLNHAANSWSASRLCYACSAIGREYDAGKRWPEKVKATSLSLMQREALQRRKCDYWHLIFCTDFTRSVPLGSQFGTSLPRRNQGIPVCN